jgi:hypothetical protein
MLEINAAYCEKKLRCTWSLILPALASLICSKAEILPELTANSVSFKNSPTVPFKEFING